MRSQLDGAIAYTYLNIYTQKLLDYLLALKTGSHIYKGFALYQWGENRKVLKYEIDKSNLFSVKAIANKLN